MSQPTLAQLQRYTASTPRPEVQLSAMAGEIYDEVVHVQPYGFVSLPQLGSDAVLLPLNGGRSLAVALCVDDAPRCQAAIASLGLGVGDVALYTQGGSALILRAVGSVEIVAPAGIALHGATSITGGLTIDGKPFASHTHSGVQSGGGTSGPVS